MFNVNIDLDENVEGIPDRQVLYGHQATVTIVHNEITFQSLRSQVIDAASPIGHVSQDQAIYVSKFTNDICNQSAEHKETFWELEGHFRHL
jgi:hypothetical protein